ncbi:type 1 glutamine amidotransferase domain-containing protein [Microbacterium terricola]|uniref:Dimethylallyltransferase n=1 Tax=Microbacterium terricola TaxID=344163 RepID=A0ABM8E2D0_9MICO|nr:type 1 glutamine amidotransferase domain-containing protein [Microbacterium terricola]UYK40360.1 type 1 glutamine amidotransferase domain-containing protein [Microbacterium terricola]BDV31926.1 dimethylallyltransferase [Microbacterium terricola]
MSTVLFVVSAARTWTLSDGTAHPTGFWAEELLTPYRLLSEAGHDVVFATPGGIAPVADEASFGDDGDAERAALDSIPGLRSPLDTREVDLTSYDAVFYPGGHAPMEDLSHDATSGALIAEALDTQKPIALVCHGLAALLAARRADGTSAAAGRRVTAFTDEEETQGGLAPRARWLLESTLREHGIVVEAAEPWADHVVTDGSLVTGQNPQSSASVAKELLALL